MLGIIFTEFVDMVADAYSHEMVDDIFDALELPSGGAYTSVGSYDYTEMLALVTELSARVDVPVPTLVRTFGKHLFGRFETKYPDFFEGVSDSFTFLSTIENHIHVEVRKLYPEAQLPSFECTRPTDDKMTMIYTSVRPFGDLAEGLIQGAADHFGEVVELEQVPLGSSQNVAVQFNLKRITGGNV